VERVGLVLGPLEALLLLQLLIRLKVLQPLLLSTVSLDARGLLVETSLQGLKVLQEPGQVAGISLPVHKAVEGL
jgi:hypothetical protein